MRLTISMSSGFEKFCLGDKVERQWRMIVVINLQLVCVHMERERSKHIILPCTLNGREIMKSIIQVEINEEVKQMS